jgi:CheY-like chemotaxis protein
MRPASEVLAEHESRSTKAYLMKFLIADDDERIRRLIKTIVGEAASVCYECGDGAQARASYAAHQPDWVLMDLAMPEMDGLTATRRIRADYPSARVIIVTADDSPAMREAARRAGALGYVLKENLFDLPELLRAGAAMAAEGGVCLLANQILISNALNELI